MDLNNNTMCAILVMLSFVTTMAKNMHWVLGCFSAWLSMVLAPGATVYFGCLFNFHLNKRLQCT